MSDPANIPFCPECKGNEKDGHAIGCGAVFEEIHTCDEPNDEWVCMDCENGVSPCAYCGYCKRHCECTYEVTG